jgi:conjugative relaxase-like TrwC/TraI family protein
LLTFEGGVTMLRIVPNRYGPRAKRYFTTGLEHDDAFTGREFAVGNWYGLGASSLGLAGEVLQSAFSALCDNLHPQTNTQLTQRQRADRRIAYDFNFHCPKSVSLMYELTTHPELLECLRQSMRESMITMETQAATRVRAGGRDEDRLTGNMVYAEFIHHTSRPVGGIPDPLLHAHCFVFNATYDPVERCWKALQVGHIKRNAPYFEAVFHSDLARRVRELGYEIVQSGRYWEIKGVKRELIDRFSRRTQEINAAATAAGITDAREKANMGPKTRRHKSEGLRGAALRDVWHSMVTPQELVDLRQLKGKPALYPDHSALVAAVRKQMTMWFTHAATVGSDRFVESVLRTAYGHATAQSVRHVMQQEGMIEREVEGKRFVTTQEVLLEEAKLVNMAMDGRGAFPPLCPPIEAGTTLLNEKERLVLNRLLSSRDLVSILEGPSHSGKSHIMEAGVYALAHRAHRSVTRLAPRGRDTEPNGQRHIHSVDTFLHSEELQNKARKGVLLVDDAQLVGTTPMTQLVAWARRTRTRVVLLHDRNEALRIRRGDSEPLLRLHAGLAAHELGGAKEPTNPHRQIVALMEAGKIGEGLQRLEELGALHEVNGEETTLDAVANDFVRSCKLKLKTTVVAHDPFSQTAITRLIRSQLHAEKLIKRSRSFTVLSPLSLESWDKAHPQTYVAGLIVQFDRNTGWKVPHTNVRFGFRAGSRWKVMGHDVWGNVMLSDGKSLKALPLSKYACFDVFRSEPIQVAAGDMIRITRNGKVYSVLESVAKDALNLRKMERKRTLTRDSLHRVTRVTRRGDLQLDNGLTIPKDFGHFDHGYCVRPEQAKNTIVDRVLLHVPKFSFNANYTAQFCMSVARGKRSAAVYTTSIQGLKEAVTIEHNRVKALDLVTAREWVELVKHGSAIEEARSVEHAQDFTRERSLPGMEL